MRSIPIPYKRAKRLLVATVALLTIPLLTGIPEAAPPPRPRQPSAIEHLDQLAKVGRNLLARLRPEARKALSAGGQQLVRLAEKAEEIKAAKRQGAPGKPQGPKALPQGFGSDPFAGEDLLTRLSGMTQSETSAGWCGSNAVIGFNDSGSFIATLFLSASPSGSLSFNGWSRSTNAGGSYADLGAIVSDPLPPGLMFRDLLGDPLMGCTSASTFYHGSLAIDFGPDFSFVNSGIAVLKSTNGGASWDRSVMAASKDANFHFLDKPWMAVAPGLTASPDDDVVHVTYTDFDFSGFDEPPQGPCPGQGRTGIEYVRSTDGGATWSAPLVLEEVCEGESFSFLQGSQVEVGVGTDVYAGWEHYSEPSSDRDIRIAKSTDGGSTFGGPQVATPVTPIGDSFALQGQFRAFLDLQGLAVDRSSGASRGTVYISWHDGRNRSKVDPFGFCNATPSYCFGDILLTRSRDGGATWSAPVRVNDDDISLGVDQFMPALDVDRAGTVWVSYHDRRRDSRNLLIDTFVARSNDSGVRWTNTRATNQNFAPVTGWQDVVVNPFYMGDYIAVASDSTGASPGVIAAWGDNSLGDPNIVQRRF